MTNNLPNRDPDVVKRAVCMNPFDNNNKEWGFRCWEKEGIVEYFWGRVGSSPQKKITNDSLYQAMLKLDKKKSSKNPVDKRYTEVDLVKKDSLKSSQVDNVADPEPNIIDPKLLDIIKAVFASADNKIKSYLAGTVDALSLGQIESGRKILDRAIGMLSVYQSGSRSSQLLDLAIEYGNVIPTIWEGNLRDTDNLVKQFFDDLHEYEDRLNQLETAVKSLFITDNKPAQVDPVITQFMSLGIDVTPLSLTSDNAAAAIEMFNSTLMSKRAYVRAVYEIKIPNERQAFVNTVSNHMGDPNFKMLYHGTRSCNIRHILASGLIIPKIAANGSRFGRGIYFAPNSARSLMYTDFGNGNDAFMFINQVMLGNVKELSGGSGSLKSAPDGYHSVLGNTSYGGLGGEYVVYNVAQQTVRILLWIESK